MQVRVHPLIAFRLTRESGQLSRNVATCALLAGVLTFSSAGLARADIFVLKDAGEVRGELVNADQSPRKTYVIKTAGGGKVTLGADQVKEVKRQRPAEVKYDRFRSRIPDTIDGQWKAAEWCRENRLSKQRAVHLQRIIDLDPEHADARRGLGYSQIGGRWVTQEQMMKENGYVRSKYAPGKWVLPQEEALLAKRDKTTKAQLDWNAKLKRWSTWLRGKKARQAVANINAIDDPFAVPALAKFLASDRGRAERLLYVAALGRIKAPAGMDALVGTSLYDQDEEIRLAALDEVVSRKYKPAVAKYVQALKHKNNPIINRAAVGLGQMADPIAVGPLIDALVTTHTFRVQKGNPGQTTTTFGTGPNSGTFSMGGSKVEVIKRRYENRHVLQALVDMTGVSFNYDVPAWKYWFVAQRKPKTLDARRDSTP